MTRTELDRAIRDLETALWTALRSQNAHHNVSEIAVSEFATYAITGLKPTREE